MAVSPFVLKEVTWFAIMDVNGEIISTIALPCSSIKISKTLGRRAKHRDLP